MSNKSHEVNYNLIDRQYKNINMITLMTSMITTRRMMHQIRAQDVPTTFCILSYDLKGKISPWIQCN